MSLEIARHTHKKKQEECKNTPITAKILKSIEAKNGNGALHDAKWTPWHREKRARQTERETAADKLSLTVTEEMWRSVCFCMRGHSAHKRAISEANLSRLTSKEALLKRDIEWWWWPHSTDSCAFRRWVSAQKTWQQEKEAGGEKTTLKSSSFCFLALMYSLEPRLWLRQWKNLAGFKSF